MVCSMSGRFKVGMVKPGSGDTTSSSHFPFLFMGPSDEGGKRSAPVSSEIVSIGLKISLQPPSTTYVTSSRDMSRMFLRVDKS